MEQVTTTSFTATGETTEELTDILLEVVGFTRDSFASYMGVEPLTMDFNQPWVNIYLRDVIDANLVHLGYVMKDTKYEGILGEYKEQVVLLNELNQTDGITRQQAINIDDAIISEDGTLKISYIANATRILKTINLTQ